MADRKLIDLGFSVAILSEDDTGEPMMTLLTPETDEDESKCMYVLGSNGLHDLRSGLAEWLDGFDAQPPRTNGGESNENIA